MDENYQKQAELLIRCLPEIEKQSCFALRGGTAINLFVRDMPRLSVDIDLVYLPIEARDETLNYPAASGRGIDCHSRKSGSPVNYWIPAFAGMTIRSKLRGIKPREIKNVSIPLTTKRPPAMIMQ